MGHFDTRGTNQTATSLNLSMHESCDCAEIQLAGGVLEEHACFECGRVKEYVVCKPISASFCIIIQ